MGWRATAGLCVALLVAGALLYRDVNEGRSERSWRAVLEWPEATPPSEQITPLLHLDPGSVTAVTLRRGTTTQRTERADGGWSGGVRPGEVDDFLRSIAGLAEILSITADAATLRQHGLDPPQATIELTRRDAPPLILLIGDRNPPATGVYVQLGPGGGVALTGALLLWDLERFSRALAVAPR